MELKQYLKLGSFLMALGLIGSKIYQRYVKNKQFNIVKQQKIKDIHQINIHQNQDHVLLRVEPYSINQRISNIVPIHSNQKYFIQPSQKKIVKQMQILLKKYQNQNSIQWICHNNKNNEFYSINNFGFIVSNIFSTQKKYSTKQLNFFKIILQNIVWVGEIICKTIWPYNYESLSKDANRRPFFLGPVIGQLQYDLTLIKDIYLVIKCRIKNGQIQSIITAISKQDILQFYKKNIFQLNLQIICLSTIILIQSIKLIKLFKKYYNRFNLQKYKNGKQIMKKQNVSEQKLCIICYTQCRNLVFLQCQHILMCYNCATKYNSHSCPICKKVIEDVKLIYVQN